MKKVNDNIYDVDALLDQELGAIGSAERELNRKHADAFFSGQIIEEARKCACFYAESRDNQKG